MFAGFIALCVVFMIEGLLDNIGDMHDNLKLIINDMHGNLINDGTVESAQCVSSLTPTTAIPKWMKYFNDNEDSIKNGNNTKESGLNNNKCDSQSLNIGLNSMFLMCAVVIIIICFCFSFYSMSDCGYLNSCDF